MSALTTLNVLRKARELVEQGWTQGRYKTEDGCYCGVGALIEVTGSLREALPYTFHLDQVVGGNFEFEKWQDRRGRTQAEVLAAFDRAIELVGGAS